MSMGCLWQTLILSRWNPVFAYLPVESLVHNHQQSYYKALRDSTAQNDCATFIEFMLVMIRDAVLAGEGCSSYTPSSNQVEALLIVLKKPMARDALQQALGLADRKSFRLRYLKPALAAGLIEMTIPDKPNSRLQQYRLTEKGRACI